MVTSRDAKEVFFKALFRNGEFLRDNLILHEKLCYALCPVGMREQMQSLIIRASVFRIMKRFFNDGDTSRQLGCLYLYVLSALFVKLIMGERLDDPPLVDNIIISGKQIKLVKDMA